LRKNKKIPIVLPPYYVLEYQEQWYPPGFSIFLSVIPEKMLNRLYWCVSPAVDTLICVGVFLFIFFYTNSVDGAVLGSSIYLLSPAAIPETQALNSRQFGSLFLSITVVSGILYVSEPHIYLLIISIISGVLLLLTHKLSTQALYISFILMACITVRKDYLIILLLIILATVILSKGYYIKILRSHIDYILFWSKRWKYLGGHQIHDSPIYRKEESDKNFIYKKGVVPKVTFLRIYFEANLYLIIPVIILVTFFLKTNIPEEYVYFALWTVTILGIGLLSYLIPTLRGIGFASQYGKLALPVGLICVGYALRGSYLKYIAYLVLAYSLYQGAIYLLSFLLSSGVRDESAKWNIEALQESFGFIKSLNDPLIMCIPNNYSDLVAYHCHKRVLWGTHGSPTKLFESIVPVLFEPLEDICKRNSVTHLLVDTRHTSPNDLGIFSEPCWKDKYINIYEIHDGKVL
jgi:hypothetical protein